jgi:CIC family chloride channel protein
VIEAPGSDVRSVPPPEHVIVRRLRFVTALVLVAVTAAAFAIAFRGLLTWWLVRAYGARDVVSAFHGLPPWLRLALPPLGGLLAGLAAIAAARNGRAQGVGDVMEAVVFGRVRLSIRTTLWKSLGSWLAIAAGGSIGREGPIIQLGASAGTLAGRVLGIDPQRSRALIAAGTAAGFAAAYNTPLAAVLFVIEVVTGVVALDAILPTVAATALATALTRAIAGGGPIYGQRAFNIASQYELLGHAALGLFSALAAQTFMRTLSKSEAWFAASRLSQPWRAAVGGLGVGAIALLLPEIAGNGYEPLNSLLDGAFTLRMIAVLVVAKAIATTLSVSSGSPGGVFTPTLLLGAGLGTCFWGSLCHLFPPAALGSSGGYALVGMAALTAATTHAPMMASVLVFELSGDYAIVLPLLLATSVATIVSRQLRAESIYTAELSGRGVAWKLTLEGRDVWGRKSKPPPPAKEA